MPEKKIKPPHPLVGKRVKLIKTSISAGGVVVRVGANDAAVILKDNGEEIIAPTSKCEVVEL
jgi:hypothetical protein